MRSTRFAALAVLLLMVLLLQGCSRSTTKPAGSRPAPTGQAIDGQVTVTETEWSITLDPSTVKAGSTEFKITNSGQYPHSVTVKGQGVDQSLPSDLSPGQSTTMTVDLKQPGKYDVYCAIDGHADQGMKTTLTVTQ